MHREFSQLLLLVPLNGRLIDAVMFDSWPVPAVDGFRVPAVRAATNPGDLLAARTKTRQLTVERHLATEMDDYVLH